MIPNLRGTQLTGLTQLTWNPTYGADCETQLTGLTQLTWNPIYGTDCGTQLTGLWQQSRFVCYIGTGKALEQG